MSLIKFLIISLIPLAFSNVLLGQPVGATKGDCVDKQCIILLRVEFLESGEPGNVIVESNACRSTTLSQQAIDAAKKLKIEPKLKDGKPVKTVRQIEYSFDCLEASTKGSIDPKAEEILRKAVQAVGGERYLQVRSLVGRGKYSVLKEGAVASFQSFVDVMVYPDKERAEFRGGGTQLTQVNTGDTGWVYDGDQDVIKVQTETQVANFKQGLRTSLDHLLRGHWKGSATLAYIGKRPATLGKRNDAIKLTYTDGLVVEFEFASDDGLPQKAMYKRLGADGEEVKEEDRYAQFVETGGIRSPYIIDHWTGGKPSSRINYESIEFNKPIPDSIFAKPANVKDAKKSWN